ncbi:MAG TPA: gamma-glutamyltransferase [Solirubrobacteraceae bacterium]|jgi:gamma-glutamyltranspeptidase/glutathione hydrolase|nr:gamma-glutamyltransferase [Solirubrobacteraceae bacterium]
MAESRYGVIAAGHPLTAQAGAKVLREGGNAVDATVAAMLTSFAAEPLLTGLGAGGYMLVAGGELQPTLLDFFVQAPSDPRGASAAGGGEQPGAEREIAELDAVDVSFGDAAQVFYIGPASCGVYGAPAGVCEAARRWGTMPLDELAAPAAELAREGVALNHGQAYIAEILAELLTSTPECAALWAPAGGILREGEVLRNPELGDALTRLGAEGPDPFYRGDIAAAVADWLGERGGWLTAEDLSGYGALEREPVRVGYRGREVLTNPPPSAGGTLIAYALALLDREPAPPTLDGVVRAMRAAQQERTPEFLDGLSREGFLPSFLGSRLGATTHISVLDSEGRACSATSTNGEGSGVVVPGTGMHLNNVMGEEDLNPFGFHLHPAGRRMPSMMAPSIVLRDGEVELVLGSAGSNRIRSAILQTIVGSVDHDLDARAAVEAPRVHFEGDVLYLEPGIDAETLGEATRRQMQIVRFHELNLFFGGVQAVRARGSMLTGAGDPRRGGVAVSA